LTEKSQEYLYTGRILHSIHNVHREALLAVRILLQRFQQVGRSS
jgi:hypothetical protein